MSILTFPVLSRSAPTAFTFSLTPNTQVFESPLNKAQQTYELPGARWSFAGTWGNLTDQDARMIKAFLARLRGQAGRFYMWDMQHPAPSGLAYGSGTLSGYMADNTLTASWSVATSLTADNTHITVDSSVIDTSISTPDWFLPGDYICVNGELKMVTSSAADVSGGISITVEPPFRATPPINTPLTIIKPTCLMKLVDDKQDKFEYNQNRNCTTITLAGVEVF